MKKYSCGCGSDVPDKGGLYRCSKSTNDLCAHCHHPACSKHLFKSKKIFKRQMFFKSVYICEECHIKELPGDRRPRKIIGCSHCHGKTLGDHGPTYCQQFINKENEYGDIVMVCDLCGWGQILPPECKECGGKGVLGWVYND